MAKVIEMHRLLVGSCEGCPFRGDGRKFSPRCYHPERIKQEPENQITNIKTIQEKCPLKTSRMAVMVELHTKRKK